jgi:hypothetical protein
VATTRGAAGVAILGAGGRLQILHAIMRGHFHIYFVRFSLLSLSLKLSIPRLRLAEMYYTPHRAPSLAHDLRLVFLLPAYCTTPYMRSLSPSL